MNVMTQFKAILEKVESEELKGELNSAFEKIEGVFTDAIQTRDKAKDTNKSLGGLKEEIANIMGFDDDFSAEDIKKVLDSKNSNADLEKLKADLNTKYENDMNTMRSELDSKETSLNDLTSKYNDTLFNTAIVNSGLLDSFVDEPMARNNIIGMIKDSLLYEDGKVFVRDNTTGDKATDIKTGEFLKPDNVVDSLKSSINPMYLKGETQANGGGTPPANQATGGKLKRSEMSASDRGNYISKNGQEAYLALDK